MRRVLAAENLVEQIKLLDHSVDMRMLQPATLSGAMELQITLRARARTAVPAYVCEEKLTAFLELKRVTRESGKGEEPSGEMSSA
jgi:hypothetical protein